MYYRYDSSGIFKNDSLIFDNQTKYINGKDNVNRLRAACRPVSTCDYSIRNGLRHRLQY